MQHFIFINRRKTSNRRTQHPMTLSFAGLSQPLRLRGKERRDTTRNLADDYYAYIQKHQKPLHP